MKTRKTHTITGRFAAFLGEYTTWYKQSSEKVDPEE